MIRRLVTIPLRPPLHQILKTILSWPVIHLVVPIGVSHISLWPQEIQPREREKKNKEQTNNVGLGQLKCIRRLTPTCILREISTKPRGMLTHLDWSSLGAPGPYLMPTGLFCCSLSTAPPASPFGNSFL